MKIILSIPDKYFYFNMKFLSCTKSDLKLVFYFRERLNLSSQEKGSSDNISTIIVFLRPIQDIVKGKTLFIYFCYTNIYF